MDVMHMDVVGTAYKELLGCKEKHMVAMSMFFTLWNLQIGMSTNKSFANGIKSTQAGWHMQRW